jgi:hypothetical protein
METVPVALSLVRTYGSATAPRYSRPLASSSRASHLLVELPSRPGGLWM